MWLAQWSAADFGPPRFSMVRPGNRGLSRMAYNSMSADGFDDENREPIGVFSDLDPPTEAKDGKIKVDILNDVTNDTPRLSRKRAADDSGNSSLHSAESSYGAEKRKCDESSYQFNYNQSYAQQFAYNQQVPPVPPQYPTSSTPASTSQSVTPNPGAENSQDCFSYGNYWNGSMGLMGNFMGCYNPNNSGSYAEWAQSTPLPYTQSTLQQYQMMVMNQQAAFGPQNQSGSSSSGSDRSNSLCAPSPQYVPGQPHLLPQQQQQQQHQQQPQPQSVVDLKHQPGEVTEVTGLEVQPGDETLVFAQVPGRLALLNSNVKHAVTVGEVKRRLSHPEGLNVSLLGGVLRKAKNRDGGKYIKEDLRRHNIFIPVGKRRNTDPTGFTALTEAEAGMLAQDFDKLNDHFFPVEDFYAQLLHELRANAALRQQLCATFAAAAGHAQPDQMLQLARLLFRAAAALLARDTSVHRHRNLPLKAPLEPLSPQLQHKLEVYNLVTHDFGVLASQSVFRVLGGLPARCENEIDMPIH